MNHIKIEDIANRDLFGAPIVEDGDTFAMMNRLLLSVGAIVNKIDHAQRPAADEWQYGANAGLVRHEPKPLTYEEKNLINDYEQARRVVLVAAVRHPAYSHSRTRHSAPHTYIYHRDPKSPSGVMCAGSGPAEIVDPLIRKFQNNSPLSPTEGLRTFA